MGKGAKLERKRQRNKERELSKQGAYAYVSYSGTKTKPIPLSDRSSNKNILSYDISPPFNPLRNQIFYSRACITLQLDDGTLRYVSSAYMKNRSDAFNDAHNAADDFMEKLFDDYEIDSDIIDSTFEDISEDDINIEYGDTGRGVKRRKQRRLSFEARSAKTVKNRKYKKKYYKTKMGRILRQVARRAWKKRYYKTSAGKAKRKQYR